MNIKRIIIVLLLTNFGFVNKSLSQTKIIFDTDLGNDVDDIMALQMLITYKSQGIVDLVGITCCKANDYAVRFIDAYLKYNNINDVPLGYCYSDGTRPENGHYLMQVLDTMIVGKKVLSSDLIVDKEYIPEACELLRKLLSEAEDNSIVLVPVGPLSNIKKLLSSSADKYSDLTGIELVNRKVRYVVIMGGAFTYDSTFIEWNIKQDLKAAQYTFAHMPVPIIASGFEIGLSLPYPYSSIVSRLKQSFKHPLRISYELFKQMPHDRPTFDLTSVLYAVEPYNNYFGISPEGKIEVDDQGHTFFVQLRGGLHRYLTISKKQKDKTLKRLVELVSYSKE